MNMKNYEMPSTSSQRPSRKLLVWSLIGGVSLLLILGFWFGRDAAAAHMAKSAEQLSEANQERYLLNLSTASWRTDSAQKALAEYYKTHQNYLKAAQVYHDGSTALRPDAAAMYAEAGKYDKAIAIYKILAKKQPQNHTFALALALTNNNQATEGCEMQDRASDEDAKRLTRLCELVEKTNPTRKDTYELADMGADNIVEKYFANSAQKTVGDWLMLARIYQKRGELDRAKATLQQASENFPYDRELIAAKQFLQ